MAKYVDGFVFVVPGDKVDEYRKMAELGKDSWMRHGALSYYECIGNDLTTRDLGGGKPVEFTELTNAKPGETVWFSFIVFESKEHRDEVNKKVIDEMNEKYKEAGQFPMPFEMHRFAYGGFEVAVEGEALEAATSSSGEYGHQGH
ncbi:MAG TPA: DUF1428 domain-containing protein [Bacteroidales bacterium]|jgi:uncharacterized protein YbaA (DUF1428 family)|nr:DUF1428 domain-containing protein [Bacteroidales bacterium]